MLKRYAQVLIAFFVVSDIFMILFIWAILYIIAGCLLGGRVISAQDCINQIRIFAIFIPVYIFLSYKFDFYAPRRFLNYRFECIKTIKVISYAFAISFFLGYAAGILHYNRIFILVFWGACIIAIFLYHVLAEYILRRFRAKGYNLRKVLIVGSGEWARNFTLKLLAHREFGLDIIGFVTNKNKNTADILDFPVLGSYDKLCEVVLKESPDIVFFALSSNEERLTRILIEKINNEPIDIRIALDTEGAFLLKNNVSELDGIPIITLRERHFIGFQQIIKRVFNLIFALIAIVLTIPLFILIAVSIKIFSSGTVFYIQERVSFDGRKFRIIKFRTMQVNAEEHTGPVWADENDSRRTKIGAWLRKTGLDELPQLLNVLKGDMSIVGPRPERPEFIEELRKLYPHYVFRHSIKAGITGLAQVNGLRGNTPIKERLKYDLDYINNYSFWLDIKIIFLTIREIFKGKGI